VADDPDNSAAFVQLLTLNQSRLYAYILSLIGNQTSADDILQEANIVLWQKASEFTPGTNFTAWMFKIAYMQVMAWRQKLNREKILFNSEMIPELAHELTERLGDLDSRQRSLQTCLQKLSARQRDIVRRRYSNGATLHGMAAELGQSVEALKQLLFRTRATLAECVRRSLAVENS